MPSTHASIETLQGSLSRITPIATGRVSVRPQARIIHDDPADSQVYEEARDVDKEDKHNDEHDSMLPEGEDNRGRDDILSKTSKDDQKEMLELNRMLLKLLFQQQVKSKDEKI
jgi:hypothetical protein